MKPKPFDVTRHNIPQYAHAKYDGIRIKIHREDIPTGQGAIRFVTSTGADIVESLFGQAWMGGILEHFPLEPDLIVDAELTSPNGFEYVKTALATREQLDLHPFATTALNHKAPLDDVQLWVHEHMRLQIPTYFDRVNHDGSFTDEAWLEMLDKYAIQNRFEGWVFKDGNYLNWLKRKPVMTIDLIVRGAKDGNNAYLGLLGSLELATTEGYVVCNCSGMDLDKRIELTELWNAKQLFGRIVEVSYDRVSSKGRLRFPRFKRMRDDKAASECRVDQDPELKEYWS